MKERNCLIINASIIMILLFVCAFSVYKIDPFFHYHAPVVDKYYYVIDNERSMNDGIVKNFYYDAIITGTSMTENFATSEVDNLFGVTSIKIPYAGATFKEISGAIDTAMNSGNEIKLVICSFDPTSMLRDKDEMRFDMGEYPTYLYNNTILDDQQYLFNKDIFFGRVVNMFAASKNGAIKTGITSFDEYANWMNAKNPNEFGKTSVLKNALQENGESNDISCLTEKEIDVVKENVKHNIFDLAEKYKGTKFMFFIPPYSMKYWKDALKTGEIRRELEVEKVAIEELINSDNIILYDFGGVIDITSDLNNYCDDVHYGEWINSWILECMMQGEGKLDANNYKDYLYRKEEVYENYNYELLEEQDDYECDIYQAALHKERRNTDLKPIRIGERFENVSESESVELYGKPVTINVGSVNYGSHQIDDLNGECNRLCECAINLDISDYDFLFFDAKKIDDGQLYVYIYADGNAVECEVTKYEDLAWHQYFVDLSNYDGYVTIIMHSDNPQSENDVSYIFRNIEMF